jgi:phosphoribosyl-ATP pyrophosphohydrolase
MSNEVEVTTAQEFEEMATKLFKYGSQLLPQMTDKTMSLIHLALGVQGEMLEIAIAPTPANLVEEFGDMEFFLFVLCVVMGYKKQDIFKLEVSDRMVGRGDMGDMIRGAESVGDILKKHTMYGKVIDELELQKSMAVMYRAMYLAYAQIGVDSNIVLRGNIDKLMGKSDSRYADGVYSDEAAINRSDKAEKE